MHHRAPERCARARGGGGAGRTHGGTGAARAGPGREAPGRGALLPAALLRPIGPGDSFVAAVRGLVLRQAVSGFAARGVSSDHSPAELEICKKGIAGTSTHRRTIR